MLETGTQPVKEPGYSWERLCDYRDGPHQAFSSQAHTKEERSRGNGELTFRDARNSMPRATWKL